jgi:hypothetical protein
MVPSGIKIGKEQLNILAYADGHCINWEKWNRNKKIFVEMENIARKFGLWINQEKTKYVIVERKNSLKKNKIGHLKIKNYKFERVENFKYLGVILNEDNNNQIDLQERITKHILCYKNFLKIKTYQRT